MHKKTGEVVGDCGLTWQRVGYSRSRVLEAGWHVRRALWNQGIATEAARCVCDYARAVLGAPKLVAIIDEGNVSSQAVARKLGMIAESIDTLDGKERVIFSITF